LAAALVAFGCAAAAQQRPNRGAALAREIQALSLDADACYRVRDLSLVKEDLRIYLTAGHLIFSKAVNGRRIAAVFVADGPGGDGEVLLFPPDRSERLSLSHFAGTPNLNEHLVTALMLFTDGTGERLAADLSDARKAPEAGLLLQENWSSVVRNIAGSYEIRLVQDLLSTEPEKAGLFFAALTGKQLGNFDVIFDPRAREQISVGQVAHRNDRLYFDVWTRFIARSWRNRQRQPMSDPVSLQSVEIDATLNLDLRLQGITRVRLATAEGVERAIGFELAPRMRITSVQVNGDPAEALARESLRSNALRGGENDLFLVIPAHPFEPGKTYVIEFRHEGDVVSSAGNRVYYVGSRGTWYPNRAYGFAPYDVTFRYPRNLDLVATGEIVDEKTEGEWRITRRKTPSPVRFAGFNLGDYEKASAVRGPFSVEVYGNRLVDPALQPRSRDVPLVPPPGFPPRNSRRPEMMSVPLSTAPLNPLARLQSLASEMATSMEFLSTHLGPPPQKTLLVSPIPGFFGQGFPGLVYLSTVSYLDPADRPSTLRDHTQQTFFSEILSAHEVAHQWWGNIIASASAHDDWVMEALASYSALMILEKRKGRRAADAVLEQYRDRLAAKTDEGSTLESTGPIVWGSRLNSSHTPGAWRVITYEKGSWIVHMLRARLGDSQFLKMLGELLKRYRYKSLSTQGFKEVAAEFMLPSAPDPKLDAFFDQWVYGTGIPELKLQSSISGSAPKVKVKLTVQQSGVDEDFGALVPVELQMPGKHTLTHWVKTASEPVTITFDVRARPLKVTLDPVNTLLAIRR
jgi:hypothetical protein